MEETTFFEYETVRVTNSRFIVDGQTFAMSNITSVKSRQESPSKLLPILLIILAVIMVLNGVYDDPIPIVVVNDMNDIQTGYEKDCPSLSVRDVVSAPMY